MAHSQQKTFVISLVLALIANLLFAPTSVQSALAASVCYVNISASGTGDGASWINAYTDLQSALADNSCAEIWVAQGVYKPTNGTDREVSFELKPGVALYGGFNGSETLLTQRNFTTQHTTLSGDIGVPGDSLDNSYHVIYSTGVGNTSVLDGFIVTGGNADAAGLEAVGGGMYNNNSHPTVANTFFSGNLASDYGGGIHNEASNPSFINVVFDSNSANYGGGMSNTEGSSPTITSVSFTDNQAVWGGGGLYSEGNSSSTLTNVSFSGNHAYWGGGIYNISSDSTLTNVTVSGNTADNAGGGMHNVTSNPTIIQSTFSSNTAGTDGGGMYNNNSSPVFTGGSFNNNHANNTGGGMHNSSGSHPILTTVTLSGNVADYSNGGGMYNNNSSPILNEVTSATTQPT